MVMVMRRSRGGKVLRCRGTPRCCHALERRQVEVQTALHRRADPAERELSRPSDSGRRAILRRTGGDPLGTQTCAGAPGPPVRQGASRTVPAAVYGVHALHEWQRAGAVDLCSMLVERSIATSTQSRTRAGGREAIQRTTRACSNDVHHTHDHSIGAALLRPAGDHAAPCPSGGARAAPATTGITFRPIAAAPSSNSNGMRRSTPPDQAPCGQQCFACRHARRTGAATMSAAAGVPPRRTQCIGRSSRQQLQSGPEDSHGTLSFQPRLAA